MVSFRFDIKKIIQITNYLLQKNQGSINYTKLIKLLYISDKRFLDRWDLTITGDCYSSLYSGPILSRLYNLIKCDDSTNPDQSQWDHFFITDEYDLKLVHDNKLTVDLLSEAEIETLDEVDREFKDKDFGYMIEYTHNIKLFPEVKWKEAGNSAIPLSIDEILKSLGRSDNEIEIIERESESQKREAEYSLNDCS
ncbi:MAG: SocA family protein [Spirochaetes bacterium]|nr:SocA family protein [Spirochaetota bacterium]